MISGLISCGGVALGAALGGAVGYSQILCADGSCAMTGSWYGGALIGALVGYFALTGLFTSRKVS